MLTLHDESARPPKTSDALSRCPINAGAHAAHRPSDRPTGPGRSLPSLATWALAVLPRFLPGGPGAGPVLVPRIRSHRMVPEPRSKRGIRDAVGRVVDQPKSNRSVRRIPRRAAVGHRGHARVPVPRRPRRLLRVRPRPPAGTIAG